jgi:CRISPR-associated protein Cas7/Csd2 subtype I-C
LSGERDAIARLHPPIKGVWGAQTSGANIISFNLDPFNSYSKIQGLNAPLGERAVFAYTTALNHLLRKGSRQRIQVGDASTVFWAAKDHPSEEQFIAWLDPDSDDPDQGVEAVRALYAAPQSGAKPLNEDSTPFYVLGLAPNAARIAIRFWYQGTVGELAQHIRQHFDDIRIAHAPYELEFLSLFRLLIATALQNKSENIPPNLAGDFMKAILAGTPYPRTLLAATLRRVRAEQAKKYERPFDIYVKEKAVLGRSHLEAFKNLGIQLGEEGKHPVPEKLKEKMEEVALPEGLSLVENQDEQLDLIVAAGIDKKEIKDWLEKAELDKEIEKFINSAIKNSKSRKPTGEETQQGREKMCEWFFDIRTFGAVMSLKSVPNCGQVRGPVQMSFARSVSPVVPLEHSITRMAVATEAESEKQSGDNRTMGRKFTIPYGLYRGYGYISAHLARQTGFSEDDLALLWEALINMFEHDHSAARGQMSVRGLYVFKHDNALGHAPAHVLFDCITVQPREGVSVPREFSDYQVIVNDTKLSQGVTLMRQVG